MCGVFGHSDTNANYKTSWIPNILLKEAFISVYLLNVFVELSILTIMLIS